MQMTWDRIEGQWKQQRGKAMLEWGKIMNDELAAISGKYELLVGKLQEKYGIAREEAQSQAKEFKKTIGQLKKANIRLVTLQKSLRKKAGSVKNPTRAKGIRKRGKSSKARDKGR
jgi:uncharacterized protein YjbJ (UPF0337 family)